MWRKSSFSTMNGCVQMCFKPIFKSSLRSSAQGNCVQVAQKSSFTNTECVEVLTHNDDCLQEGSEHFGTKDGEPVTVLVRDSKNPDGPRLRFTAAEWDAFLAGVVAGEFGKPKETV